MQDPLSIRHEHSCKIFYILQAVGVIDEVGDLLALKYSKLKVPNIDENEVELIEVSVQNLLQ